MKRIAGIVLCLSVLAGAIGVAAAQEAAQAPHKVLVVAREMVKPGKGGMAHEKAESLFVQAFTKAKWPTHYVGMTSLSGKQRALFFLGYDSFEAWEKDNTAMEKDPALASAIDHAGFVDGDLLDSMENIVFSYREDYSLRPNADLAHRRYMEISVFQVKEGHRKEWDDSVKMVLAAFQKSVPDAHWACYEIAYGAQDGTFIFLTMRSSLAEVDKGFADNKDFMATMGDDGMKKLEELTAASVESSESHLFALNPRMSYVPAELGKADPFWNAKPAMEEHKKAAAKKPAAQ